MYDCSCNAALLHEDCGMSETQLATVASSSRGTPTGEPLSSHQKSMQVYLSQNNDVRRDVNMALTITCISVSTVRLLPSSTYNLSDAAGIQNELILDGALLKVRVTR